MNNTKKLVFLAFMLVLCRESMSQIITCNQGQQNRVENQGTNEVSQDPTAISNTGVEASRDPNEIIGLDGYDVAGSVDTFRWVSATQTLAYTVYFENDADFATAAASKVTINVPLHPKLNYATLGIGSFGFGSHIIAVEGSPSSYQTRIDLRDSLGIFVDVVAGLDIVHNKIDPTNSWLNTLL